LHRESADAPYELVLAHENAIDVDKIAAEIRDGVLRVSLPKHEALKPRKIAVN
jgi:HSP20 family molecular chaperone IbpA